MTGVDVPYRSRRLAWPSSMIAPAVDRSPAVSAAANSRTRAFSLMTCVARRSDHRIGDGGSVVQRRAAQRTDGPLGCCALGHSIGVRAADQRAMGDELHHDRHVVRAWRQVWSSSAWQSISSAWPATAAAMLS